MGDIKLLINKYPIVNSDWSYIDNTNNLGGVCNLYELINSLSKDYFVKRYKYSFSDPFVEGLNKRVMDDCERLYSGVNEYFVRRLCTGDSLDMGRCALDPWHRSMMIYQGQVYNMNMFKEGDGVLKEKLYNKWYVVKDVRSGGYICGVSVTSVESIGIYCLDIYE